MAPESPPWWQTGVVYQIYPRSFQDSDGDGVGDLSGIAARLDYLATLGANAIWISPFYPSPMKDFGYDVADYCDVDPLFGTLADFDRLLAAAHARGLRLIVDWVPNHTSDQHPWFRASRRSRADPKRAWYVWRDPRPDGSPPNNWLSSFGGPAWAFDERTGQYYLHSFLPEQPDLDWRNPEVRAAMLDTLRFWLDRGVDGIRIDVVTALMKDPALRDNPPAGLEHHQFHKAMGAYGSQLHVNDRNHPDQHEVLREVRRLLDSYGTVRSRVAIGELHVYDLRRWALYYGAELDELHLPFNFGLLDAPWSAAAVRRLVDDTEAALPPGAWPNWVVGNHDEHRIASRVGERTVRTVMALLLTLRGTPTLYYGDELAIPDVHVPPELAQDPWGKRVEGLGLGRDPARTPMQWDASPGAGFAPPGVRPWLPLTPDTAIRNVEAQSRDPDSMLSLTRRLLQVRRAHPALDRGSYRPVDGVPEGVYAYRREHGSDRVLVLLDFLPSPARVALRERPRALLASTEPGAVFPARGEVLLRPHEAVILEVGN
jgi:glycosidase